MKILIVSDLHNRDITSVVPAKTLNSVDFMISAGDYEKYPYPIQAIGVYGNHDYYTSDSKLINCHLQVKRVHGLKFMGVQGVFCSSKRYYSNRKLWYHNLEEDIDAKLAKMPKVDFFITHSRAKEIFNRYHDGSQAFRNYIEKKKPRYYISGHSCSEGAIMRVGDTCCLNPHVCGALRYLILDLRTDNLKVFDINLTSV
jgi:Icc-related predicted phosphoesterase